MRWEQLFADLEAQFAEQDDSDGLVESASRARAEYGRLRWADRVRGSLGSPVTVTCRGTGDVAGRLVEVGTDWLLLTDEQAREILIAAGAVCAVAGLGARTAEATEFGPVARRLDLRRALRGLARDRAAVRCCLDEGTVLTGTVDRVGADFLELAEHPLDEPRRRGSVSGVRAIVLDAVAVVSTAWPVLD